MLEGAFLLLIQCSRNLRKDVNVLPLTEIGPRLDQPSDRVDRTIEVSGPDAPIPEVLLSLPSCVKITLVANLNALAEISGISRKPTRVPVESESSSGLCFCGVLRQSLIHSRPVLVLDQPDRDIDTVINCLRVLPVPWVDLVPRVVRHS